MRVLASVIFGATLLLGAQAPLTPACAAPATSQSALTAVTFTPRKDSLEFLFRAEGALSADQISVYGDSDDADVLNLKIDGAAVTSILGGIVGGVMTGHYVKTTLNGSTQPPPGSTTTITTPERTTVTHPAGGEQL